MSFSSPRQALSRLSIQSKLIVINLTVTSVALLFAVTMAVFSEYSNNRDQIINALLVQARMVANNSTAALVFDDPKGASEVLQAFTESDDIRLAVIYKPDGNKLASYIAKEYLADEVNLDSDSTGSLDTIISQTFINATSSANPSEELDLILDDSLSLLHDVEFDGEVIGKLLIGADVSHLYSDIIDYLLFTSMVAALCLALASLLLLKLRKSITRPLKNLTALMDSVTRDNDYTLRIDNNTDDEIGKLSRGFNKMLAHIQENDEKLAHELSERYKAEEHLDKLAYYDVTTKLPNRHSFQQQLIRSVESSINSKRPMALLFLDLDNFKTVNDTLGHKTGDMLLKQAASRLSNTVRQSDYIFRIGGDEFAIIIEDIKNIDDCQIVAQKSINSLSNPFTFNNKHFFIGVSIGISICPDDTTSANELLVNADMAMYEAKLRGKNNYVFFNKEMNVAHSTRYQLEADLRHAMDNGELELYYQPQIDAASGKLVGAEALMRWNHPDKGQITPDKFIPIAEETGLIVQIGKWLLRTSCDHARQIDNSHLKGISLAINISGKQLHEPDFIDTVSNLLDDHKIRPSCVEFELTESILMSEGDMITDNVSRLKKLGVDIAIDDFGTGYSSMGYLKNFPISKLKIDKSFIAGLPHSSEDSAIAQAIIAMSHSLGIKVIAEGVEYESQASLLKQFDCDAFQGYYYAKPMRFDDLLNMDNGHTFNTSVKIAK